MEKRDYNALKRFYYGVSKLDLIDYNDLRKLYEEDLIRKIFEVKEENSKTRFLNMVVVALITLGFFISMLTSTDISRLNKQWNREYVVMQFGIYTYQINDGIASLKPQISPLFGYDDAAKEFREYYEETGLTLLNPRLQGMSYWKDSKEGIKLFLLRKRFTMQFPAKRK